MARTTSRFAVDAESLILLFLSLWHHTDDANHIHHTDLLHLAQSFFLLHVCITTPHILTEREVYYRHPQLFLPGRQAAVQRAVQRLCCWLDGVNLLRTPKSRGGGGRGTMPASSHSRTAFVPSCAAVVRDDKSFYANATDVTRSNHTLSGICQPDTSHVSRDAFTRTTRLFYPFDAACVNAGATEISRNKAIEERTDCTLVARIVHACLPQPYLFFTRPWQMCQALLRYSSDAVAVPASSSSADTATHAPALQTRKRSRCNEQECPNVCSPAQPEEARHAMCYTREALGLHAAGRSLVSGYLSFGVQSESFSHTAEEQQQQAQHAQDKLHVSEPSPPHNRCLTEPNDSDTNSNPPSDLRTCSCVSVLPRGGSYGTTVVLTMEMAQRGCCFHLPRSRAVLVVIEKECVLRTLLDIDNALQLSHSSQRAFVLVCTKGYPCQATRLWLRRVHRALPQLPLLALVDGDAHGMSILLTLMGLMGGAGRKHSSSAAAGLVLAPECKSRRAALLPIRWVGIRTSAQYRAGGAQGSLHASLVRALTKGDDTRLRTLRHLVEAVQVNATHANAATGEDDGITSTGSASACRSVCARPSSWRCSRVEQQQQQEQQGVRTTHSVCDSADDRIVSATLRDVYDEVKWMQRAKVKCEIEQATQSTGALSYITTYCDTRGL